MMVTNILFGNLRTYILYIYISRKELNIFRERQGTLKVDIFYNLYENTRLLANEKVSQPLNLQLPSFCTLHNNFSLLNLE